jgi:5-carboxymethyl-2-hydroxymuconate isomerase
VRFAQCLLDGRVVAAVARDDDWHLLADGKRDMADLLSAGPDALASAARAAARNPLAAPRLLAPLRPGKIIAIGLNYADHIRESGMEQPAEPLMFAKFPSTVIGPGEPIQIELSLTERVDWEVELAVVVGRTLRRASPQQALEGVFGYCAANDVTARDLQLRDGQWLRGKSLDTFCPLGPELVSADEVGDPQQLRLTTRVNGETVQDSSTAEMIFGVGDLLAECSRAFTLDPGDVLLTGTPWGCGEFMEPRRSLRPGDMVEVEVERIGVLANPVVGA